MERVGGIHNFQKEQISIILTPRTHGWGQDLGNLQKMYLQGQKKSPISGKSLGLGFFSLRESFHFLVWLCSLGLRPRLHNCQTAKFIPWSDCVASASGLGYTTVRPRNENFLSRKRNPGRELFHLWSTCFWPYRTYNPRGYFKRCNHSQVKGKGHNNSKVLKD